MRVELGVTVSVFVVAVAIVAGGAPGCLEPRERDAPRHRSNCTTCHGSPVRGGDELTQSAPPFDLAGRTDHRFPGVGAHLVHLLPNDVHDGVACAECHVVPEQTESPGHADSALPAEIVFGEVAASGDAAPRYDAGRHRCSDTHCHFDATPDWVGPSTPAPRCERCHGMPPPPPHPSAGECVGCHGAVVDAARRIVAPARHVDGVVDVDERCDGCHGSGPLGAPPPDLSGDTSVSAIGVGAHAAHLAGGVASRPLACSECHLVPAEVGAPGHLDMTPRAEVILSGVAESHGRMPSFSIDDRRCASSWCHGPSEATSASPPWTEPGPLGCGGCHGMPPPAPHPQIDACALCHEGVIDESGGIVDRQRHVDGVVDVAVPVACQSCHGDSETAAPPPDLEGHVDTSFPGVGAHRAHLEGSGIARKVECGECHVVPASILAPGHLDTAQPAEVSFSGVARAFGASPSYDGMRCVDSYCHGDSFPFGHESGGTSTQPIWTQVDGTQTTCTSCHGLPPPFPHPPGPIFCSDCHSTVGVTLEILDPERHVDGVVDF